MRVDITRREDGKPAHSRDPMAGRADKPARPGMLKEVFQVAIPTRSSTFGGAACLLRLAQRSAGALAIAAALLAPVVTGGPAARAAGIYDNMEYLAKHLPPGILPPGILHVRDRAIRILYAQEVSGLWDDFDCILYRLESDYGGCFFDSVIVERSSRNIEPSLYLLREQINFNKDRGMRMHPDEGVHQMRAFDEGMWSFYGVYLYRYPTPQGRWQAWHRKGYKGHSAGHRFIEEKFIHSIAYAAYDDKATAERKAWEYLEAELDGKKRVILDMKGRFQAMGNGDRNSRNHRDPYNRKLVAHWASFWLEQSYWRELNKTNGPRGDLIYENIEMLFRNSGLHKVRGPPHYKY